MNTTNTAFDSVIEHATETTKAAGERAREFAQIGVRKATEGFEQISKAAQTATEELNSQMLQARESATKAGLKLLEVAKEDTDASFAALTMIRSSTRCCAIGVAAVWTMNMSAPRTESSKRKYGEPSANVVRVRRLTASYSYRVVRPARSVQLVRLFSSS